MGTTTSIASMATAEPPTLAAMLRKTSGGAALLTEWWQGGVAGRNGDGREWPRDRAAGIVPAHAALGLGVMEFGDLVEDLGVVGQGLKAVGHALGNVQHAPIVRAQLGGDPASEGR